MECERCPICCCIPDGIGEPVVMVIATNITSLTRFVSQATEWLPCGSSKMEAFRERLRKGRLNVDDRMPGRCSY